MPQHFARGYAHVPRYGEIGVRDQSQWPVVILLSNDQRHDLSAPMRSRCLFSWLPPPTPREEIRILSARCPQASRQMLIKTAKMINAIRGLPGIIDKPGLRESIALLRAFVAEGCADLTVNEIEDHLCFLAKRRLDLENLRKSLARVEVVMELRDGEIESWVDELERRAAARTQPRSAGTRTTQPLAAGRSPPAEAIRNSSMTGLVHQLRQLWRRKPQSLTHLCEQLDARYGIPRPAVARRLPPCQAAILFLSVCAEGVLIIASGILSAWLWVKSASWLSISIEVELFCHVMSLAGLFIAFAEAAQLPLPYYHLHQRSTYGTSRWADPILLKDLGLSRRKGEPIKSGELPLGGMGTKYDVVLNAAQTMCHLAMFGPPGSGKSATFFTTWLRAWAATGSAIVLDPKGELYDQTAFKFENVLGDVHESRAEAAGRRPDRAGRQARRLQHPERKGDLISDLSGGGFERDSRRQLRGTAPPSHGDLRGRARRRRDALQSRTCDPVRPRSEPSAQGRTHARFGPRALQL
jgi:hypothetical protein